MEPDKIITAVKNALEGIQGAVWGPLTVLIIAAAGAVVSLGTGFIQLRGLKQMLLLLKRRLKSGGLRQSMTALGATVGSGSVSGVAAALAIGGPGALFWLWVSGLFGIDEELKNISQNRNYEVQMEKIREASPFLEDTGGDGDEKDSAKIQVEEIEIGQ